MAIFAEDQFVGTDGTDLTAHAADTGGTWLEHASDAASAWQTMTNRARNVSSGSNTSTYYLPATPAGVEYDVEGQVYYQNATLVVAHALLGRIDTASHTWYEGGATVSGTDRVAIWKVVAGVRTEIGTNTAYSAPGSGLTDDFRFEIKDATKKVFVDGVEVASTTDNAITAAGKVGIRGTHTGSTTGPRWEWFKATDIGGGAEEKAGTDTGTETEGTPAIALSGPTDSATATDTASALSADTATTDSAALTEGTPQLAQTTSDSAAATDTAATLTADTSTTDTAAVSEGVPAIALSASDSAALTEGATVGEPKEATDTVSLTETSSLTITLVASDATALSDVAVTLASLAAADSGTMADASSLDTGAIIEPIPLTLRTRTRSLTLPALDTALSLPTRAGALTLEER